MVRLTRLVRTHGAGAPCGHLRAVRRPDDGFSLVEVVIAVVLRLAEVEVSRRLGMLHSRLQRLDPSDPATAETSAELLAVDSQRRALRERIAGG